MIKKLLCQKSVAWNTSPIAFDLGSAPGVKIIIINILLWNNHLLYYLLATITRRKWRNGKKLLSKAAKGIFKPTYEIYKKSNGTAHHNLRCTEMLRMHFCIFHGLVHAIVGFVLPFHCVTPPFIKMKRRWSHRVSCCRICHHWLIQHICPRTGAVQATVTNGIHNKVARE